MVIERVITPIGAPSKSRLLVATPRLEDPSFRRTVVLMVEHTAEGSIGIVLNRPSPLAVSDVLPRWGARCGEEVHLLLGGPVEPDALLAVAVAAHEEEGCTRLGGMLSLIDLGADPDDISADLAPVLVFSGYAGWGSGQLLAELREGSWWVFDSSPDDLSADPAELWHSVLARQRGAVALLREYPDDPNVN